MKLVADSGSTKTDWYLVANKELRTYTTQGYNPYYCKTEEIQKSLELELLGNLNAQGVKELYFYGSGCANELTKKVIMDALVPTFSRATISLGDDLLAAARATAGHEEGICCILGTGANSCYYNGEIIADKIPSLGYILGDEGAGSSIGKKLIKAYFYREMPVDLERKLELVFDMDKHIIITTLLDGKNPNRFLAKFAMFCSDNKDHPFVENLLFGAFDDFLTRHILKYPNAQDLPVHFIGSIAFGFKDILIKSLEKYKLSPGKILKSPFPSLLEY
jgi:glucosamine kinase